MNTQAKFRLPGPFSQTKASRGVFATMLSMDLFAEGGYCERTGEVKTWINPRGEVAPPPGPIKPDPSPTPPPPRSSSKSTPVSISSIENTNGEKTSVTKGKTRRFVHVRNPISEGYKSAMAAWI